MKKFLLAISLLLCVKGFAQDTVGLIAHWDMNGTVNDVSGHGHNGTANHLILDTGMDGVYGHAYYLMV
jgi:hypothetical protein